MTAPICGARTYMAPGQLATCARTACDGLHDAGRGLTWRDACVTIEIGGEVYYPAPHGARSIIASLQRQLDALDPDAAIAEAERRMVEAHRRARDLSDMEDNALNQRLRSRLGMAMTRAYAETSRLGEVWLALVEARDAKGGGA